MGPTDSILVETKLKTCNWNPKAKSYLHIFVLNYLKIHNNEPDKGLN